MSACALVFYQDHVLSHHLHAHTSHLLIQTTLQRDIANHSSVPNSLIQAIGFRLDAVLAHVEVVVVYRSTRFVPVKCGIIY